MSGLNLANAVVNNYNGWFEVLQKTLDVASYKKFFEVTSHYNALLVKNDDTFYKLNKRGNCHENCRQAEADGLGLRVSGWYVMNEFTHDGFADGMCRLVHHSNLMLADGSLLNITSDNDASFHIFIQDDVRDFDFDNRIGYNDRMVFGDSFLVGRSVPRNKVHFAAKGELSRDIYFEKFKIYTADEKILITIPTNLSYQEQIKWITLKTNCYLT
jgi:hypothetical protein